MTDQRKRLEKALRGCAEAGVANTVDLWPAVKERTTGERANAEPAVEDPGQVHADRRFQFPRVVPNAPLGWALAAVSALIIGVGVYAAAGPVRDLYRQGLPGTVESGSKKADGRASRGDAENPGRQEAGQTKVADGVKVTLDRIDADAEFVAISYTVEDLEENRNIDGHPSELTPVQIDDTDRTPEEEASDLPPRVDLTDGSGQDFDLVGGSTSHSMNARELRMPKRHLAVFARSGDLESDDERRFSFKIAFEEAGIFLPGEGSVPTNPDPDVGPFTFDFDASVRPVPVVHVNEEETAEGTPLTLKRVVNSRVRPQAWVCLEPPDDDYRDWTPWLAMQDAGSEKEAMSPFKVGGGCWSLALAGPVEGRSSITVSELMGFPRNPTDARQGPKTIRGPWTFEFEAPER